MRRRPSLLLCAFCLLLAVGVPASPAMVAPAEGAAARARESFTSFAQTWIARARARGERASEAPRARPATTGPVFTYQAVDEAFETELRSTGRPNVPWVGVLHYTEHTYTCQDARGRDCRVTSSLPLTEVFRYRDGRWSY